MKSSRRLFILLACTDQPSFTDKYRRCAAAGPTLVLQSDVKPGRSRTLGQLEALCKENPISPKWMNFLKISEGGGKRGSFPI